MTKAHLANCVRCGKQFFRVGGMYGKKICQKCRETDESENTEGKK